MLWMYMAMLETAEQKDKIAYIYENYAGMMYHVAIGVVGEHYLAEDAVHETFLRLIRIIDVEGQKRKVTYHLQNNNRASYDCNESLGDVEARLGTQGFLRTYRTILVNMRHICFLNRTHLTLTDGTDLPVSKQNSNEIMQTYNLWVGAL